MGKHISTKHKFRVAAWPFIVLVLILVASSLVWWWMGNVDKARHSHMVADPCPQGTVTLTVQGELSPQLATLLKGYKDTKPVIRDKCVETRVVGSLTDAALWLTSGPDDIIDAGLSVAGRSAATETWPVAYSRRIGVAYRPDAVVEGHSWSELAREITALPSLGIGFERPVAAAALADGNVDLALGFLAANKGITLEEAIAKKTQRIAVAEDQTPEGYSFYAPDDLALPTVAVPLTATSTVDEDQARAAFHFANYLGDHANQSSTTNWTSPVLVAAKQISQRLAHASGQEFGAVDTGHDTLVLFDASANMDHIIAGETLSTQAARIAKPLMLAVGRAGGHVALWSFSSPERKTNREAINKLVDFTDVSRGVNAAEKLGTVRNAGIPLTRTAVVEAMTVAADHAEETGHPVKIVVITTATGPDIPTRAFQASMNSVTSDLVSVRVVHVGTYAVDTSLAEWATQHGGSATIALDTLTRMSDQLQAAFGVTASAS